MSSMEETFWVEGGGVETHFTPPPPPSIDTYQEGHLAGKGGGGWLVVVVLVRENYSGFLGQHELRMGEGWG